MTTQVGRLSELNHFQEEKDLKEGMDFRLPEYRREVFLRFYEFHTKRDLHPGCVYYMMPALAERYDWSPKQRLWFAYLNGNTQNPVTSWIIMQKFPTSRFFLQNDGLGWFNENWKRLDWDMDRRYQKKDFPTNVLWYDNTFKTDPLQEWQHICIFPNDHDNFTNVWKVVRERFPSFGRLAAFSYIEYLKIMGIPVECDDLFLDDISGSASHRNGLAIVLGRDDLDFHKETPKYTKEQMQWLKGEAEELLFDAHVRVPEASYFTLESALCTYKSWHRKDRRYPNVYNDMLYERIKKAEENWPEEDFEIFWHIRTERVHPYLLKEKNPKYPGLDKSTQNWYRQTGQVILMDLDWECFRNDFCYNYAGYQKGSYLQQVGAANPPG